MEGFPRVKKVKNNLNPSVPDSFISGRSHRCQIDAFRSSRGDCARLRSCNIDHTVLQSLIEVYQDMKFTKLVFTVIYRSLLHRSCAKLSANQALKIRNLTAFKDERPEGIGVTAQYAAARGCTRKAVRKGEVCLQKIL